MGERFDRNLYRFNYNDAVNFVDLNGLWGIAFGNNSGSFYFNFGWGAPSFYVSPGVVADTAIAYRDWVIGENGGQAWVDAASEPWVRGPTGGLLPQSLANGMLDVAARVRDKAPCPQANGMHAWHAGSNAYLQEKLGFAGTPFIFLGGLFHESPLDWGSFQAEQHWQGTVNHSLDSATDIVANMFGLMTGIFRSGDKSVDAAIIYGNYIPGPGEPDPAFGGNGPYRGNPVYAWGQYPP